jgi:hypothetical protein
METAVDHKDSRGWSALHHAAVLGQKTMIDTLLKSGANAECVNDKGGTYLDFLMFANLDERTPYPTTTGHIFEEGSDEPMSPQTFHELTKGCTYLFDSFITGTHLVKEWVEPSEIQGLFSFTEKYKRRYVTGKAGRVQLELKQVKRTVEGQKLSRSVGLGLFARNGQKKGALLGEYIGVIGDSGEAKSNYTLSTEGPDGLKGGNEISRVNCSFPNSAVIGVFNTKGVAKRRLLIQLDNSVDPGGQYCWNYGFNEVKLGPYIELRPQAMRDFIKEQLKEDPMHLLMASVSEAMGRNMSFEEFAKAEKLRYIVQTPAALYAMVLDGSLSAKVAKKLLSTAFMLQLIPATVPKLIKKTIEIAQKARDMSHSLEKANARTGARFRSYIEQLIERHKLTEALSLIDQFVVYLKRRKEDGLFMDPVLLHQAWIDMEKETEELFKD